MPLQHVKAGDPISATTINLLIDEVNRLRNIKGSGDIRVKHLVSGITISNYAIEKWVLVVITGDADGGAKYTGRICDSVTSTYNSTDDFDGFIFDYGDDCLILNRLELGSEGHDYNWRDDIAVWPGLLIGQSDDEDSKPVVVVWAIPTVTCTDDDDGDDGEDDGGGE